MRRLHGEEDESMRHLGNHNRGKVKCSALEKKAKRNRKQMYFQCPACPETFTIEAEYRQHWKEAHAKP